MASTFVLVTLLALVAISSAKDYFEPFVQGYALQFVPNQYVHLPSSLQFGGSFSIEFVIRWRGSPSGTILYFSSEYSGKEVIAVRLAPEADPSYAHIELDICNRDGQCSTSTQSNHFLGEGEWNYVSVIASVSGWSWANYKTHVSFYVQESGEDSAEQAGSDVNPRVSFGGVRKFSFIGRDPSGNYFNGDLDEVRLWSSIIENPRRCWRNPLSKFLVASYSFDEGVGSIVKDSSRNGYHGSLGNGQSANAPIFVGSGFGRERTCSIGGCKVWVTTFDKYVYPQRSFNVYTLAQGTQEDQESLLNVQVRVDRAVGRGASVTGVAFLYQQDLVVVDLDYDTSGDFDLIVNNFTRVEDDISLPSGLVIHKRYWGSHQIYTIQADTDWKMEIVGNRRRGRVVVKLKLSEYSWKNHQIVGLCGNFDGVKSNDDDLATNPSLIADPSFFGGNRPSGDSSGFVCTIPTGSLLDNEVQSVCYNNPYITSEYQEACASDVCATQDISSASFAASSVYESCLEDNAASNATGNPCVKPCPGFCSFHGTCLADGTCQCDTGFGSSDCSQQALYRCYTAQWASGSFPMLPFVSGASVGSHYRYEQPYGDSSNTGNEVADSSVFYLYQQSSTSSLSLVWINDKVADGSGGKIKASFKATNTQTSNTIPLTLSVKDDPNDKYQQTNGIWNADWKWESCCTDGLALTGNLQNNQFCISVDVTPVQGINQLYASSENLFGEQDLQAIPLSDRSGLKVCGNTCVNPCGSYYTCSSCMADTQCGWCSDSGTCEQGGASGPIGGRCSAWRYANNQSRVIVAEPSYPIDPSDIQVSMKTDNLNVQFYVNFPSTSTVPLEVFLLYEVTSKVDKNEMYFFRYLLPGVLEHLATLYPSVRVGLASFSDKPVMPYGRGWGDHVLQVRQGLTNNLDAVVLAAKTLTPLSGGDSTNAQLEALLGLATAPWWTENSRRVVLVITETGFHDPVGGSFIPNNGDMFQDANEDYPSRTQLFEALLDNNVIPIFLAPESIHKKFYGPLVAGWGFGVNINLLWNPFCVLPNVFSALESLGGTAKVFIRTPGKVSAVSNGYSGISPYSRVRFTATVNALSASTDPAVLVVPGFGKLTISYLNSDAPAGVCPITSIDCQTTSVIQLSGVSATYGDTLRAKILSVPSNGRLYQFGTNVPIQINAGDFVSDPGLQLIYDPLGYCSADFSTGFTYALYDSCDLCSTEESCSIFVTAVFPPPIAGPAPPLVTDQGILSEPYILDGSGGLGDLQKEIAVFPDGGLLLHSNGSEVFPNNPVVPDSVVLYLPGEDQVGEPASHFAFRVKDTVTGLLSTAAVVPIIVIPKPPVQPPVPLPGTTECLEDTNLCILQLQSSGDNVTVWRLSLGSLPARGTFGTCTEVSSCPPAEHIVSSTLYYIPAQDDNGEYSLLFAACTSTDACSAGFASHKIIIHPVNDRPVVSSFSVSVDQNSPGTPFSFIGYDVEDGTDLSYSLYQWNGPGTLQNSSGAVLPYSDGPIFVSSPLTYIPVVNAVYNFVLLYEAVDSSGLSSWSANGTQILIQVNRVSYACTSSAGTPQYGDQFQNRTIVLGGSNINSDSDLSIQLCNITGGLQFFQYPSGLPLAAYENVSDRTVTGTSLISRVYVNSDTYGKFTFSYKTVSGYGDPESSCFEVQVNITAAPRPFAISPITGLTTLQETDLLVTFVGNSTEAVTLAYQVSVLPASTVGAFYLVDSPTVVYAASTNIPNGELLFRPVYGVYGATSFNWQVVDNHGLYSDVVTVALNVTFVNHAPVALNQPHALILENTPAIITLSGTDRDNSPLTYFLASDLANSSKGILTVCSNADCSTTVAAAPDVAVPFGTLLFTPGLYQYGDAYNSFTFYILDVDANPLLSNVATVTFDVQKQIYSPSAQSTQQVHTNDRSNATISFSGNDPHFALHHLEFIIISETLKGSLYLTNRTRVLLNTYYPVQTVTYVPTVNMGNHSQAFDTITYQLRNPDLATSPDTGSISVFVEHVYSAPVAIEVEANAAGNAQTVVFYLGGFDPNPGQNSSLEAVIVSTTTTAPLLYLNGTIIPVNGVVSDRTVQFTPNGFEWGSPLDTFTFKLVNRNTGLESNVTVGRINVPRGWHAPIVNSISFNVTEDTPILIELHAYDPDGDELLLRWAKHIGGDFYQAYPNGTLVTGVKFPICNIFQGGTDCAFFFKPFYVMFYPAPNQFGWQWLVYQAYKWIDTTWNSLEMDSHFYITPVQDPYLVVPPASNTYNYSDIFMVYANNPIKIVFWDVDIYCGIEGYGTCAATKPVYVRYNQPPVYGTLWTTDTQPAVDWFETSFLEIDALRNADNSYTVEVPYALKAIYYGTGPYVDNWSFYIQGNNNGNRLVASMNITVNAHFYSGASVPTPTPMDYPVFINFTEGSVSTTRYLYFNASDGTRNRSELAFGIARIINSDYGGLVPDVRSTIFFMQTPVGGWTTNIVYDPVTDSYPVGITYFAGGIIGRGDYNTLPDGSLNFTVCYRLANIVTGAVFNGGVPYCGNTKIFINPSNDAPSMTCTSCTYTSLTNPLVNWRVDDVDCTGMWPGPCGVHNIRFVIANSAVATMAFVSVPPNVTCFNGANGSLFCKGSIPNLNTLLIAGLQVTRTTTAAFTTTIALTIFDNGNWGLGPQVNRSMNRESIATLNIPAGPIPTAVASTLNEPQSEANSNQTGTTAGALVGGTSLISGSIYGVYRLMKKRKLLPEDANPWETDDTFDNTLDNPLYNGMPTTSQATTVTMVTSDT